MPFSTCTILVNFGGPRNYAEILPFLQELLTDPEVIHPTLPSWLQTYLFRRIAKKRAKKVEGEYAKLGGVSPIYEDTRLLATLLEPKLNMPVWHFHRYLPSTHSLFFDQLEKSPFQKIWVFPLFPQFSYTTTGSIARIFSEKLSKNTLQKLDWVPSYARHLAYLRAQRELLQSFLQQEELPEEKTLLLFSAHGIPQVYIEKGDPYEAECVQSFRALLSYFPKAFSLLSYQSQFGKQPWIRPYTQEVCEQISLDRPNVVIVPLSFTSDHLETLVEIEEGYLPILRKRGVKAFRCPALNQHPVWVEAIGEILQQGSFCSNDNLLRTNLHAYPFYQKCSTP